ncbi:MAG TPA: hypothetical protein VJ972_06250, partial [Anaerolineales bacterium]|nr:hypothetical protein [Anaerolineales bacterium]
TKAGANVYNNSSADKYCCFRWLKTIKKMWDFEGNVHIKNYTPIRDLYCPNHHVVDYGINFIRITGTGRLSGLVRFLAFSMRFSWILNAVTFEPGAARRREGSLSPQAMSRMFESG